MNGAPPGSVAVVGGGVVGLCCAYYLRRDGVEVTVVERDRVGRGCSWGNLGWVCPSISVPLPAPGLGRQAIAAMLDPDSPLYIKGSAMPRLAGWLASFWSHCNERDFERGSAALRALNVPTDRLLDELAREGVAFEHRAVGLTFVSGDPRALDAERRMIESVGAAEVEVWSTDRLAEREPALPHAFVGALHVPTDRHVRADTLCAGLRAAFEDLGGRVVEGVGVEGFERDGARITALVGSGRTFPAEAVILATGAEAADLTGALGLRLPIQAGKGYSLSIERPALRLESPLYLCDQKVGLTPYNGMLRVGGTMELSGINRRLDRRRLESIRRVVSAVIPDAFEGGDVVEWVGMRPLTPDGLPAIGRLGEIENAFVATGHQMLGVTLAPSTGRALADVVLGRTPTVELDPFDPGRFSAA